MVSIADHVTQKLLSVNVDDVTVLNESRALMIDEEVLEALTTIAFQVQLEENDSSISIRTPNIVAEFRFRSYQDTCLKLLV